jgi:ribose transport system substrate-binding protein
MKKMTSILAACVLGLGVLLSGCGSSASPSASNDAKSSSSGKTKVAVVLKSLNSDYWKIVEAGAKAAAQKYNVDVEVLGPSAETEVEKQVSLIEDQITNKVNALVVAPSQPASEISVLQKAKEANIPVVLADTDADFPDKVSFVGTGNLAAGKQAGEYLASQLHKGDKVAIIRGAMGDRTHDERTQGAEEALKAAGIEIATVQPADSDRNKALSVMENILQSNPDVKGVFGTNDEMALGAERAAEQAKAKLVIVGLDGSPNALDSIKSGGMAASVAQDPYQIGFLSVEAAVKAVKGEKVEKRIDSGTEVITQKNVNDQIAKLNKILGK